ncbi:MAG TPA: SRPBCC domain-containing protein [Ramlibacter sp.]|nr:SRPBCC domain-containing protein [Ramlibacter sp.]
MAQPTVVRVAHRYTVPAERVFDAWITPAQAGRFLFATRTGNILHCEIDPQVGGFFTVTDRRPNADGDESFFDAQHRGQYLEIDRPRRLVFEFGVEPFFESATRVTIDIQRAGNGCELSLTHELGDSDDARAYAERTRQGWTTMLQQLDKVLTARTWGFRSPGSA